MRFSGPLIRRDAAVSAEHVARPPSSEAHQIALLAPFGQPVGGKGVPELMWMEPLHAGLSPPLLGYLTQAGEGQGSELAEPKIRQMGE